MESLVESKFIVDSALFFPPIREISDFLADKCYV